MFDSFLSKFKVIFNTPEPPKKAPKSVKTPQPKTGGGDYNRVVFNPKKATQTIDTSQAQAQAKSIIDNAKKIETEAKNKEAEILQRLRSIDDKEKYLFSR